MANSILAALLAGALALSPAASRAQVAITIAGGITAPVSTLGDIADLGYHLSGGVNYGIPTSSLGFRFEGGYDGLSLKNGSGDDARKTSWKVDLPAPFGPARTTS